MTQTPRIRYHLTLPRSGGVTVLDAPDVIPWVRGYAAALGQTARLDVVDFTAAEDTVRVQILQVGDSHTWFRYMFQTREGDED